MLAGIELGGTKSIAVLAMDDGAITEHHVIPTTTPDESLATLSTLLGGWDYDALGIASFGPIDLDLTSPTFGSILSTPKPNWNDVNLKQLVVGDKRYRIDTDVNGAALAEGLWGDAQHLRNWAYITVGTGIGVGTIIDRKPLTGIGHSEAGHMRVPIPVHWTTGHCPYHGGCAEGLISGPALAARVGIAADQIPSNDPIWDDVSAVLAALCHNLVLTTLPDRIFIGGGVGGRPGLAENVNGLLHASLSSYGLTDRLFRPGHPLVGPSALKNLAGPQGAIALARYAMRQ